MTLPAVGRAWLDNGSLSMSRGDADSFSKVPTVPFSTPAVATTSASAAPAMALSTSTRSGAAAATDTATRQLSGLSAKVGAHVPVGVTVVYRA
jgi:hypothetical protein